MLFNNLTAEACGYFRSDFVHSVRGSLRLIGRDDVTSRMDKSLRCSYKTVRVLILESLSKSIRLYRGDKQMIKLKSLILAQIERWRHALHMQVERQHGELAL